jgi:hypothetical protein
MSPFRTAKCWSEWQVAILSYREQDVLITILENELIDWSFGGHGVVGTARRIERLRAV